MDPIDIAKLKHRFVCVLTIAVAVAPMNIKVRTFTGTGHTPADAEEAVLTNFKTNGRVALDIPAKKPGGAFAQEYIHNVCAYVNAHWQRCTATLNSFCLKDA